MSKLEKTVFVVISVQCKEVIGVRESETGADELAKRWNDEHGIACSIEDHPLWY